MTRYYYAGAQRVALRTGSAAPVWLLGDHLGSASVAANTDGSLLNRQGYLPWGELRFADGGLPGRYKFTGQASYEAEFGLYFFKARWYDSKLGRFISPDPTIPEPYNPLAYDRYQYVYSNPMRYTDSTGHCIDGISTWICIALLFKAIDYGWTAYDAYQSGKVLSDPNASREEKLFAGLNVGLAVIFEAGEPDDFLPAGLPLDDVGRRAAMKGAREAFEQGGEEALEKFLRNSLGDYSDEVLAKIGALKPDPNKLHHIFDKPGRQLDELVNAYGSQTATYNAVFRNVSMI